MKNATTATLKRSIASSTAAIREAAAAGNRDRVVSLLYTTRDVIDCLPAKDRAQAIESLRSVVREIDGGAYFRSNKAALVLI